MADRAQRRPGSAVFLLLLAAVTLFPLVAFFLAALQPAGSLVNGLNLPRHPQWHNFLTVWRDAAFGTLFANSFLILVVVVPATVVLSTLAGFAFGTMEFRGRGFMYTSLILGLTLPVELIVIPIYFDFQSLGLLTSYVPVILTEIAMFMPFGAYWMTAYFRSVPTAIIEAARVDGAANRTILRQILLPGARPAITALGVLTFVWSWNQFLLVLVLIQEPSRRTAPAGLGFFVGEHSVDVPSLAAATFIVMGPPLLIYLFFQRQFILGTLAGAMKE